MPFVKLTLAKWMGQRLADPNKRKTDGSQAFPTHFAMVHKAGMGEKEVYSTPLLGKTFDDSSTQALANVFESTADNDCQDMPGRQEYIVYAFYEDSNQPQGRFIYKTNGHIVSEPGETATEAPTNEGRLQQRMRHDEAYSQVLITGMANLVNQQNQFIKVQGDRLDATTRENTEMFTGFKEMMIREADRNHEHTMAEMKHQRGTELMNRAMKLIPPLANTVSGREIFPQSTADTAIVEALADAIDETMLAQLAPLLAKVPPEMMGVLMSRMESIVKEKTAAKERAAKLAGGNGQPYKAGMAGELGIGEGEFEEEGRH
jgi:hypothetical protein